MSQLSEYEFAMETRRVDGNGLALSVSHTNSDYIGVTPDATRDDGYWRGIIYPPNEDRFICLFPGAKRASGVFIGRSNDSREMAFLAQSFLKGVLDNGWQYMLPQIDRNYHWRNAPPVPFFKHPAWSIDRPIPGPSRKSSIRNTEVFNFWNRCGDQIGRDYIVRAFNTGLYGDWRLTDLKRKYGKEIVEGPFEKLSVMEFAGLFGLFEPKVQV